MAGKWEGSKLFKDSTSIEPAKFVLSFSVFRSKLKYLERIFQELFSLLVFLPTPHKRMNKLYFLIQSSFISLPQQNLPSPRHVNPSVAKELTVLEMRTCWFIGYRLKKKPIQLFRYQVSSFPGLHKANTLNYYAQRSMARTDCF